MTTSKKRPYRAIFTTTITPAEIERRTASTGSPYLFLQGAGVEQKDGTVRNRTVMAFRRDESELNAIEAMLQPGVPVRLAVQYDQGTLKIIGEPRDERVAA